ncbi:GT2 family glycosyltransferase [Lutibacter oceani]|uniref:GT2 family glycosyltransferase n=1 Tax=Lutibacter oceani TaxID=1853311 RepID=A0A3D9RPX7_9FLAO|nr:glycosyltransferase family A protein [Lutibacter oceani]REE81979.1 GT2 family glycosyltransferase [Lutibacter oceani]
MLFKFLKYINPTNYFNLERNNNTTVFPDWDALPKNIQAQIKLNKAYSNLEISKLDGAYQAIQKGYIGNVKTINFKAQIPIEDEYRFIRTYFNKLWVYYTLLLRLITFHNPLKEFKAFFKTRKIIQINVFKEPISYPEWDNFKSELLQQQPKVSVIIPTLNRYNYLIDVLKDLEKQDYQNFEVIVVDQSEPFQESFYKQFKLNLKLIYQQEKALWLARNTAIKSSNASYFLLFDDDSRVATDWITNHLKCIDFFNAEISSGTSISVVGAKVPESYRYFKLSDQIDTGNVLIKRKVFEQIGLFDRQFEKQRMGDGEFGLRAYLAGFLNISNPTSERLHLKVATGGLRQMGSWDGFRPKKWFSPRPIPSVVYLFRKYFGNKLTRFALLKAVPPSLIPYKYKNQPKMMLIGYLLSVLLLPLVLFQVFKSWKLASKKLEEGSLIEKLI